MKPSKSDLTLGLVMLLGLSFIGVVFIMAFEMDADRREVLNILEGNARDAVVAAERHYDTTGAYPSEVEFFNTDTDVILNR